MSPLPPNKNTAGGSQHVPAAASRSWCSHEPPPALLCKVPKCRDGVRVEEGFFGVSKGAKKHIRIVGRSIRGQFQVAANTTASKADGIESNISNEAT